MESVFVMGFKSLQMGKNRDKEFNSLSGLTPALIMNVGESLLLLLVLVLRPVQEWGGNVLHFNNVSNLQEIYLTKRAYSNEIS